MRKFSKLLLAASISSLSLGVAATAVHADDFPERDIRMVIPFGPGGATDIIFRLISQEAEKHLGVSIVPVNMAGAGATLGSRNVKDADPDGYTLLGSHDTIALSQLAGMVDYSYEAFDPVALLTQTVNIATTYPGHPVEDAGGIVDYIRENPGDVRFSMIPTSTDHFFWAQFLSAVDVDMDEVRLIGYGDTGEQVSALLAEEIDFTVTNIPSGASFYEDGTLRPLGVAHTERLPGLEDIPTLKELGIDMVNATSRGLFAPKGTPQERIDIIAGAYEEAMKNEELLERIKNEFGSVPSFLSGSDYKEYLDENQEKLAKAAENIDYDG
ncbi:Bug family tripartite tricarboxylate transporter substrate binding protein [Halomonas marinisediminis]|uniref:Tripartite tricarboxylate transporter substrate binding protein n=1 Tax=Halomonas marinisediminis TaxID=2546095 RepID=A0ABY2D816_9GAMM|nr:tripartite tricarboxylate transporter substrate binding protein [Halomonas marinisediminis]TDB03215.1 tripartite tricarboxylate transporter substrate binding protein [Halomonas marinisediminis]